jgi:hypothetical protein
MKTSFPENLKSFGSLTAWLRPLMNIFAVCMVYLPLILIDITIYIITGRNVNRLKVREPAEQIAGADAKKICAAQFRRYEEIDN